ncbi:MAG: hypothetical protein JKY95_04165 [Planctomycetaceae bacterium]|nr:hypothetical protein [Planctomycetaceae bacterium]
MASPIGGGDPQKLFDFFSVDTEDDKLLVLAWTLAALCPDVPVPMLLLIGTQGSAKTTRSRRLRSLLDPSVTPVLGDIDMSNLFLTFDNHALPCFENVSKFNRSTADMFCRAVTGNYVERRKLFTNSDQVLYSFQRPIIINGIDAPSTRPDFLDRCIAINCRRMKTFKPIRELDAAFEAARPKLLGSLLDLLVKTLKEMKHLPVAGKFRMADFAHFGRAMTVALGRDPEEFDTAYLLNIKHQDQEILEATPMTSAVTLFAKSYTEDNPWKGTAGELLILLRDKAHTSSDKDATSDLPKNARWLSCRLSELVTALAANGVIIDRLPRTKQSRGWKVYATGEVGIKGDPKKANRDLIEEMGTPAIVDQDEST